MTKLKKIQEQFQLSMKRLIMIKQINCKVRINLQMFKELHILGINLIQEKMRVNLNNDDDDPALVSKNFWSLVKATSNSSRIPEYVSYGVRFRNNAKDQSELFNAFFMTNFYLQVITTFL